jgi:hypothetical protein
LVEAEELVGAAVERAETVRNQEHQATLPRRFDGLPVDDARALEGGRYQLATQAVGREVVELLQQVLSAGRGGKQ